MGKVPDRETYLNFWGPRIGRVSAKYMWWSKMVIAVTPLVVVGGFIFIFGSVKLDFRFALALAWIVGSIGILFVSTALPAILLSYRSASKALRIKVSGKSFPPVDESDYRRWCREYGLAPHSIRATQT